MHRDSLIGSNSNNNNQGSCEEKRDPLLTSPLSPEQRRLWILEKINPTAHAYNEVSAVKIIGALDLAILKASINDLALRHQILTSVIDETGPEPVLVTSSAFPAFEVIHVENTTNAEFVDAFDSCIEREITYPFDMARGPLLRATVLHRSEIDNVLVINAHHIVFDGWSIGIFQDELSEFYRANFSRRKAALEPLPFQYGDFARRQLARWTEAEIAKSLAYWTASLANMPVLPSLAPPPEMVRSPGEGRRLRRPLHREIIERLRRLGKIERVTEFSVLLTVFAIFLHRHSGAPDFGIGIAAADRPETGAERLIGFFVNTLVLRANFSNRSTFRELLGHLNETAIDSFDHRNVPFERIVDELRAERGVQGNPLFRAMFVYQANTNVTRKNTWLEPVPVDRTGVKYDLTLMIEGAGGTLDLVWEYDTALYDAATVERFSRHFVRLAEAVVEAPDLPVDKLAILSDAELAELDAWNATAIAPRQPECVHRWFETQVKAAPNAIAVSDAHESLTYDALNRRANQLAKHLLSRGVGNEERIAILLDRCCDLVVAILAVLKAGGAYLPLNPSHPRERLIAQVRDADATLVLSHSHLATLEVETLLVDDGVILAEDDSNLDTHPEPDALAYVIYTSGSSGVPKGVMISHRALANSTFARQVYYREPVGAFLLVSPIIFDSSIAGLFWTLVTGGTLVLSPQNERFDVSAVADLAARNTVTHLLATPSLYELLLDSTSSMSLSSLQVAIVAGEACSSSLVTRHFDALPDCRLYNEYGPTETCVWASAYQCRSGAKDPIPIGFPIANMRMHLLSAGGQEVPVGVVGEIHIGGPGLGRGYIGRPDLTAERFIEDPRNPTNRLYRTGDLGRRRMDGSIDYLGRIDDQIKVRGFRVEPAEIEAVLGRYPDVLAAAVVPDTSAATVRLDAFVVARRPLSIESLRQFLMEYLPNFMIPEAFFQLPALPLTTNGKLDKKALAQMRDVVSGATEPDSFDWSESERLVAAAWSEVLNKTVYDLDDDFFESGGDSLSAVRVHNRLVAASTVNLAITDIFKFPTIRTFAAHIDARDLLGKNEQHL